MRAGTRRLCIPRSTGRLTAGRLAISFAWMPRNRWNLRALFSGRAKPGQMVLSLDRVPDCDVFRAGDGVHAAWLQRRSRFESAWKSRLRVFNLKHAALLALERQVFKTVRSGDCQLAHGGGGDRPLARFSGSKDPRRSQWDRRRDSTDLARGGTTTPRDSGSSILRSLCRHRLGTKGTAICH